MSQSKTLSWSHNGLNTDGTPIAPENFRGWTLEVNGEEAVSVPRPFVEGEAEYSISTGDMPAFEEPGNYIIRMRMAATHGDSAWTEPVSFRLLAAPPSTPFGLAVA